ncbi:MAG: YCF48-related protein [Candidatus Kapaibacterium sp.]
MSKVIFVDGRTGFIVGDEGLVLRTTDGGTSWNQQDIGFQYILSDIQFPTREVGMIVGDKAIFRTTDGGNSWLPQQSGYPDSAVFYSNVFFQSADTGIIVGSAPAPQQSRIGIMLRTTNGGVSWTRIDYGELEIIVALVFTDREHGIALDGNGAILRTADGGLNWKPQPNPDHDSVYVIAFANDKLGLGLADQEVLRTTDGGYTWTHHPLEPDGSGPLTVAFRDEKFAIAAGGNEAVNMTTDGGLTWKHENGPGSQIFYSIAFLDSTSVTAVGSTGTIRQKIFRASDVKEIDESISSNAITGDVILRGSSTTIHYNLSGQSHARLSVFDSFGRRTELLVDKELSAGAHDIIWDYSGIPNGIYFYQLVTGEKPGNVQSRKVIVGR